MDLAIEKCEIKNFYRDDLDFREPFNIRFNQKEQKN